MSKFIRLLALMLAALTAAVLALPAFADVIVEPQNGFYWKHSDECRHDNWHNFVVKEGGLSVHKDPESGEKYRVGAGSRLGSQWRYTDSDGKIWAYYENYEDSEKAGWFRLEDTLRLYDHIDFEEEHGSEFYADTGERSFSWAVAYEYPNGPVVSRLDADEMPGFLENMVFHDLYRDENGREWGYVGYRFGHRDYWICLDEPENDQLTAGGTPLLDPITGADTGITEYDLPAEFCAGTETPEDEAKQTHLPIGAETADDLPLRRPGEDAEKKHGSLWLILGAVAAAAIAAAGAVALTHKKPGGKNNID